MQPFDRFPTAQLAPIRWVLSDVDDTLTQGPRLAAATYAAIERLAAAGYRVVPVTAAPAGWCDLMARMWPIAAVIGENGGLCFRHDAAAGATERRYWAAAAERDRERARLVQLGRDILARVPGSALAPDQAWRETTLAFVNGGEPQAPAIAGHLAAAGARSTVNSMWVLGWFGGFDKLAMTRRALAELFAFDIDHHRDAVLYIGDSLNDEPMFGFFPHSVGVATVRHYVGQMRTPPRWITKGGGGAGFVEVAAALFRAQH
jgi:HAD superfamily hydrolase (TIGR01484 family)